MSEQTEQLDIMEIPGMRDAIKDWLNATKNREIALSQYEIAREQNGKALLGMAKAFLKLKKLAGPDHEKLFIWDEINNGNPECILAMHGENNH